MSDIYTVEQKIDMLFKKVFFNLPSTGTVNEFIQEDFILAQLPFVIPNRQIFSDILPNTAPALQYLDEISPQPNLGVTFPVDYSHIKKYLKMTMESIIPSDGRSYKLSQMVDMIPFTFDAGGSYTGKLYRNDGITEIVFGFSGGSWLIDYDTGILTFHNYLEVSSFVTPVLPPKITFFRYEGFKGLIPSATVASDNTIVNIFTGGALSGTADNLSAIIIDDRDLGTFSINHYSMALNIGGYHNGSWRILVQGGGNGNPENTSLVFQKRVDGSWVTKNNLI